MNSNVADVSDRVVGCTLSHEKYIYNDWTLFDTVGLSEGSKGTVDEGEAMKRLKYLLNSLSRNGISLAIMVIGKGRITTAMEQNYKLFANTICMGKVPIVLMVTKCEDSKDMEEWWRQNKIEFDNYQMTFADAVCGCAKDPSTPNIRDQFRDFFEEITTKTRVALMESINRNMSNNAWIMDCDQWMEIICGTVAGILLTFFMTVSTKLIKAAVKIG